MNATDPPPAPRRRSRRRLFILLALGVVLLGGAAFIRHYYLRMPPIGEGPAGPAVPAAAFAEVWSTQKVLVIGLGDSITAGLGTKEGRGYLERLFANPPDEYPEMKGLCLATVLPNLELWNLAMSGSDSRAPMEWQIPQIPEHAADVLGLVFMTTGGNDLIHSYGRRPPRECAMYGATLEQAGPWIAAYEQRLDATLAAIESQFPGGCHIFLGTIYDPSDQFGPDAMPTAAKWPDAMKILDRYNETIAKVAARHPSTRLVDIHALFVGHGFRCDHFWASCYRPEDPHFWFAPNLIEDPNDRGHDAIRRLALIEVAKAFGKLK
jgi:lysophospholipase L1-like esterase